MKIISDLPELRLSGWGVLGKAFRLFAGNALPFLLMAAIVALPVELLKNYWLYTTEREGTFLTDSSTALFLCVLTPIVTFYLIHKMRDGKASVWCSFGWGLRRWPRIVLYGFLQSVITSAGFLLLIVPGLFMFVRLMLLPIVVSVENTSVANPLETSRNMAVGQFWRYIGYAVAILLSIGLLTYGLYDVAYHFLNEHWIIMAFVDAAADWLMLFYTVLLVVIYLNDRKDHVVDARREERKIVYVSNENRLDQTRQHSVE
ncbi:YciC family protein [Paenibacillus sp. NPDC058071]|uniref:YciC family protein n=1 Tax=Paenibacillus sp. NPDC058071 TaxID=3346326 RepID=UPI0036D7746C